MDPSSQTNSTTQTTTQSTTNESKQSSQTSQEPNPLTPPSTIPKHNNNNSNQVQIETKPPKSITNNTQDPTTKTSNPTTKTSKTEINEDIDIATNSISNNQNLNKIKTNTNNNNSNELDSSSNLPPPPPIIPLAAKQFTFGCQIMIINLNSRKELNKKLGFVIGDYKPYSKRIPIRLITDQTNPSNSPTYLLKLSNLQFVSNPIPGYDVIPYNSNTDTDTDSASDNESTTSTSSEESSLSDTLNIASINIKDVIDEDDDIKNESNNKEFKISDEKLEKINSNMSKYYDIMQQFNKPETIDLCPSITSTKSLPIDCGLRWEPKPITESIANMQIDKIGIITNIINDIEIVIQSIHSPQAVITFDSVLCLSDHTAIGRVDDIFGAVKKPYYFVRLTVEKATELKDKISLDQYVYAVKPLANFVIPPQTDERYSSQSECDNSSDDEQYRPKIIHNKSRRTRAMSVDRQVNKKNSTYKRKYYNNNNNYNNKRQRYSQTQPKVQQQQQQQQYNSQLQQYQNQFNQLQAQHAQVQAYQPYYYPQFNPLPTAIPPPQNNAISAVSAATTATYFRPQVNIIPSPPTQYSEYMSNVNRYGISNSPQQHQSPSVSVSSAQQQQQVSPKPAQSQCIPNATISINPFSFTKKK